MATIHDITGYRKATALRYYATYGDLCGTATRGWLGGYTFRPDTTQATRVVSISDPALVLLGRCDLADAARAADEAAGSSLPASAALKPGAAKAPIGTPYTLTNRRTTMSSLNAYPMLTPHDDTVIAWQQACVPGGRRPPPAA